MIAYKIPIVVCFAHSRALPITKCTLSRRFSLFLSLATATYAQCIKIFLTSAATAVVAAAEA